jgi:hypothetical protein
MSLLDLAISADGIADLDRHGARITCVHIQSAMAAALEWLEANPCPNASARGRDRKMRH